MIRRALVFCTLALFACQTHPTKVTERQARVMKVDHAKPEAKLQPITMDAETVVVDARPAFEYSMAHIPGSVNLQWDEFTEANQKYKGKLTPDLFSVSTRLARLGVGLDSKVVIVGQGQAGDGQEGRLAWMLRYLGVENVEFTDLAGLKIHMTNTEAENHKSAPIWKPVPKAQLMCTREEFLFAINSDAVHKPQSYNDQPARLYKIIDTRSEKEYLRGHDFDLDRSPPDVGAINIEWKEFLTRDGRPKMALKKQLMDVGILPQHRVLLVDKDGVKSSVVAAALTQMGYSFAGNCEGGWMEILSLPLN